MNIYDKREIVLGLQEDMLTGAKEKDDNFLSLINFENWCCNSGLSGFLQDFQVSELKSINDFGNEHNFTTITKMISVIHKYLEIYGKDFAEKLNEKEYNDLCQYDNAFYEIHDQYTEAIYRKYFNVK